MNFLETLADSAFSEWLSVSMLGFPTLIALHSVGMAIVVGLSLMVTLSLYLVLDRLDAPLLPRLLNVAVWGFALNLVTGLALFITRGPEYIVSAMFLSKMLLVVISATILFWLRQRLKQDRIFANGSDGDNLARLLSLVSTIALFGAVVAGRLIAYLSSLYR